MWRLIKVGPCFLVLSTVVVSSIVSAETTSLLAAGFDDNSSWDGYVQVLPGYFRREGLSNVIDSNEIIDSFDTESNQSGESFFFPIWQVSYTGYNKKITLFIGTPHKDLDENEGIVETGISYEHINGMILSASYVPKLTDSDGDVWQDPYITGQVRQRTETTLEAIHLGAEYIMDSPLTIRFSYGEQAVKNDHAGESLSNQLTAEQIEQLQRDIKFGRISFLFTLALTGDFYLIPGVSSIRANATGEFNSFTGAKYELSFIYQSNHYEFFYRIHTLANKYHKINPVFNAKREDNGYGLSLGVSYLKPFAMDNMSLDLMVYSSVLNSSIHYYDEREESMLLGLTYKF